MTMLDADIELNGIAYVLAPGTYERAPATPAPAMRTGRVQITTDGVGQRAGPGAGGATGGNRIGPVENDGVEPWPSAAAHADGVLFVLPTTAVVAHAVVADYYAVYIGIGRHLYKSVLLSSGSWSNLTFVSDMGAGMVISGLFAVAGHIVIGLGPYYDAILHRPSSGATTTWRSGERVHTGVGYQGQLFYTNGRPAISGNESEEHILRISLRTFAGTAASDYRYLDAPIVRLALHDGKVAIATKSSLSLMGGQADPGRPDDASVSGDQSRYWSWRGDPEPIFSHGLWTADDDFRFLLSFQGKLWTWLGGRVQFWDGRLGWEPSALEGQTCYGACVAGGLLVVTITARNGNPEVWAHDGAGWWPIFRSAAGGAARVWPAALWGAGNRDLLVFRSNSATYDLYRTVFRGASLTNLASSGEWQSGFQDAGEPGSAKAWRAVGATFAVSTQRGNGASASSATIALDYSLDAGVTWTVASSLTATPASKRLWMLEATLAPGAAVSSLLQLRVRWDNIVDWAPVLTGAWAEYTLLARADGRRRWKLGVRCRDRAVGGNGVLAATGRQQAAGPWAAWQAGTVLSFKDIDHAATGLVHAVRIESLAESVPVPAAAERWGDSMLTLTLVEL